ncbi:MAG: low molecular weight protein-tyrosine-phosphatase [Candidatus Dactylopiibacterium sp.]|nr:low molecular weight protein-tyrosine-phosphatase [Candidatus Dactylopiibacterium sp.]
MTRILFVCTGNICRSPTADGVARHLAHTLGVADRFEFDSAGTHAYHVGEAPDPRACKAARKRGYELGGLRARVFTGEDYDAFDLILAMDQGHLAWLLRECPREHRAKIRLFLDYSANHPGADVPDPYYDGPEAFERVLDMCEEAIREILRRQA